MYQVTIVVHHGNPWVIENKGPFKGYKTAGKAMQDGVYRALKVVEQDEMEMVVITVRKEYEEPPKLGYIV